MKQFFKVVFGSCLGTLVALGLILFIVFAIGAGSSSTVQIKADSVLDISLSGIVPELTDNFNEGQFSLSGETKVGLNDIVKHIRKAATDDRILGIHLRTQSVGLNPTSAYLLAEELDAFAASGKPIYAYGDYFTQSGYILAAMADSIWLNPNGLIDLR